MCENQYELLLDCIRLIVFCLISSCYTVDNAIKLVSDIFTEVSKKLSQQDLKVCEYQFAIWFTNNVRRLHGL